MTFRFSRLGCVLVLGWQGAGCATGGYDRSRVFQPPAPAAVAALTPGETKLQSALTNLGAPVYVLEAGHGMTLAWGWQSVTGWNIDASAPVGDVPGQYSFSSADTTTEGLVLFFDEAWVLEAVHQGYLANLLPTQARPRDLDEDG